MTGEQNQLLCSDIPGAGKTVLASIVINNLLMQCNNDVAVTWIYCSYKEKGSQTTENLLATVLLQPLQQRKSIATGYIDLYKKTKESKKGLPLTVPSIHNYSLLWRRNSQ